MVSGLTRTIPPSPMTNPTNPEHALPRDEARLVLALIDLWDKFYDYNDHLRGCECPLCSVHNQCGEFRCGTFDNLQAIARRAEVEIGIQADAMLTECECCHDMFGFMEMELSENGMLCKKCMKVWEEEQ